MEEDLKEYYLLNPWQTGPDKILPFEELTDDDKKALQGTTAFAIFHLQKTAKPIVEQIGESMNKVVKSLQTIFK